MCRRNILDTQNKMYLSNCRYNSQSDVDSLCPIFVLGDIVKETQATPNDTYNSIAVLVRNLSLSLSLSLPRLLSISLDLTKCVN